MPKSPTLYRLAADRQYHKIPLRVQTNPEDLLWTDRYGSTALHILCQVRNVDKGLLAAVDAILEKAPEQVSWANIASWTPLHFAVEKPLVWRSSDAYSTALILRLIRACPAAVSQRTKGGFKTKTPFHIACEAAADYKVLKAMLTINPSLATEPYSKRDIYSVIENPIQALWKAHLHLSQSGFNESSMHQAKKKMALLLQAAHCGTVTFANKERSFRILNAVCAVRCPRDYFAKILNDHVDDVRLPDEKGLHALHYTVRSVSADSQAYTEFVLEALLNVFPQAAAQRDDVGKLPLHVAISSTFLQWHRGGLRELTLAHTDALRTPDPESGLVPFLGSAEAAKKSRMHLSTTYELLRAAPDVTLLLRPDTDAVSL
jgi:ankyrin repeat protein